MYAASRGSTTCTHLLPNTWTALTKDTFAAAIIASPPVKPLPFGGKNANETRRGVVSIFSISLRREMEAGDAWPIAPKPVDGDPVSGDATFGNKNSGVTSERVKRKYVSVCEKNTKRRRRKEDGRRALIMTDQRFLIVVSPDGSSIAVLEVGGKSCGRSRSDKVSDQTVALMMTPPGRALRSRRAGVVATEKAEGDGSFNNQNGRVLDLNFNNRWIDIVEEPDRTVLMNQRRKATAVEMESWVTVECVTDGCMKMLMAVGKRMKRRAAIPTTEITVRLVLKQEMPRFCTAFSCKVRLQYMWNKEKLSRTLPCDVWKMDGGFAWRLDVVAALSLVR
ncbi:hypothetical protein F3Y22_tig00110402pilonHSYRG00078 [Hibiscus syriacus]|uniref:DUF7950 domain-containing protein n=1 Tax=Hibiscus syriacus TaxID=106335 RepID=A0A6A3ATP8_HIBSY|nr:hypothetical protein F3Y22_tig00110402pilonHSYRG00078 [Hibiscus syriacus]